MGLKKRINNLEHHYFLSEGKYYGQFLKEFCEANPQAKKQIDRIQKLIKESSIEIPFWYLQGKDGHSRQVEWLYRFNKKINRELNLFANELRAFVKQRNRQQQKASDLSSVSTQKQ